jgi:ribosomal protein L11 methyltransferase
MWLLTCVSDEALVPRLEELSDDLNCLSFTMQNAGSDIHLEDKIGERPKWTTVKVELLFDKAEEALLGKSVMTGHYPNLHWQVEELVDRNWLIYSLKDFKPIHIQHKLWIYPHWMLPDEPTEPCIILDPGFAFGTGQHETTRMCLEWIASQDLSNKVVIDYGCGSGILGLAAVKMGSRDVYGIDIDPQACEASLQNAKLNAVSTEHFHISIDVDTLPKQADVIIANIVMNPLLSFRDYFAQTLKKEGRLILSGLLKEQLDIVVKHYQAQFKVVHQYILNEWGALVLSPIDA